MGDELVAYENSHGELGIYLSLMDGVMILTTEQEFKCDVAVRVSCCGAPCGHCCNSAVFRFWLQTDRTCVEIGYLNCNNSGSGGCNDSLMDPPIQIPISLMSLPSHCPKFRVLSACTLPPGTWCHTGVERVEVTSACGVLSTYAAHLEQGASTCPPYPGDCDWDLKWICPDDDIGGWIYFESACCCTAHVHAAGSRARNQAAYPPPSEEELIIDGYNAAEAQAIMRRIQAGEKFVLPRIQRGGKFVGQAPADDILRVDLNPLPAAPDVRHLLQDYAGAVAPWTAAGISVIDKAAFEARSLRCAACPFWDSAAYSGVGKCKRRCCSGGKRWLKDDFCPEKKW